MLMDVLRKAFKTVQVARHLGIGTVATHFAGALGRDRIGVKLKGAGDIVLRLNDSDLSTFHQVYVQRQYDLGESAQGQRLRKLYNHKLDVGLVPLIIDAGANVGAAAIWFAQQFPKSTVYALEPDDDNAEICRRNCARFANIVVIEGAIGGHSGFVSIQRQRSSWGSTTRRAENETGVPVHSVADVVAGAGAHKSLFIVKVDIEGFESDLFSGDTSWVDDAGAIYVEPHDWLFPGGKTSQTMQKALMGRGFEIVLSGENMLFVRDTNDDMPSLTTAVATQGMTH